MGVGLNTYLNRRRNNAGRESESKTARRIGARLTPASGALESAKGDMEVGDFLIENKSTVKGSLSLKFDWLSKIVREAEERYKIPALTVQFTDPKGNPQRDGTWVCIPEKTFKELTNDR